MGNSLSINLNDANHEMKDSTINTTSLVDYIDMIATNYILKQNMIDMIRFTDKEYYDNMIILTSYIMKKQLNNLDIGILKNRVMDGFNHEPLNQNNKEENENMYFAHTNQLKEITIKNEKMKQKALLIISKFYIKIMTLFSAIVATIDPQYVYQDEEGNKQYFNLRDYNSFKKLDSETKELRVSRLDNPIGLVKKRLAILKNKIQQNTNNTNNNPDYIVLNPGEKFCEENQEGYKLNDEIGIKELDVLYFDEFDYETKTWNKRSQLMQRKYDEDVLTFYQIFTGKKEKPAYINTFEDIETLPFHQLKRCVNKDYYQDLLVSKQDRLFKKYMEKIYMIQNITKSYKKKMLHILKQVIIPSEGNSETSFTISPSLRMETLLRYQDDVRDCINKIYVNCERLFIEALMLYEKMYERQHGVLVENQINHLEKSNNAALNNNMTNGIAKEANVTLDANALGNTPMEELSSTPANNSFLSPEFGNSATPTLETPTNGPITPAIMNSATPTLETPTNTTPINQANDSITPAIVNSAIPSENSSNTSLAPSNLPTTNNTIKPTENSSNTEALSPPVPATTEVANANGAKQTNTDSPLAPPVPAPSVPATTEVANANGVEPNTTESLPNSPPVPAPSVPATTEVANANGVEPNTTESLLTSPPVPAPETSEVANANGVEPNSAQANPPPLVPTPETSEVANANGAKQTNTETPPPPAPETPEVSSVNGANLNSAQTPSSPPLPATPEITPSAMNSGVLETPEESPFSEVNKIKNNTMNTEKINTQKNMSNSVPPETNKTNEEKKLEEITGGTQDILHTMRNGIRGFLNP